MGLAQKLPRVIADCKPARHNRSYEPLLDFHRVSRRFNVCFWLRGRHTNVASDN